MRYTIEVYASAEELPPDRWNEVVRQAGAGLFYHAEWLAALERAKFEDVGSRWYVIVQESPSGKDLAVFPFEEVRHSLFWLTYLIEGASKHLDGLSWIAGPSLYGFGGPLPLVCAADPIAFAVTIGTLGRELAKDAGAAGCAVQNVRESARQLSALSAAANDVLILDANCIAPTRTSFEEYVSRLSKSVRNDLKRRRRRAAEHGVVVEVGAPSVLDLPLEKLHSLLTGPFERHEVPRLYSTSALREILSLPFTRLLVAKNEDKILGVFVMFLHETTLYVWAGGIDYEWLREYSTYTVLIYEMIAFAHLTGVRHIEFGRANLGFKNKFGFNPCQLHSFYWLTSNFLNLSCQLAQMGAVLASKVPELYTESRSDGQLSDPSCVTRKTTRPRQ